MTLPSAERPFLSGLPVYQALLASPPGKGTKPQFPWLRVSLLQREGTTVAASPYHRMDRAPISVTGHAESLPGEVGSRGVGHVWTQPPVTLFRAHHAIFWGGVCGGCRVLEPVFCLYFKLLWCWLQRFVPFPSCCSTNGKARQTGCKAHLTSHPVTVQDVRLSLGTAVPGTSHPVLAQDGQSCVSL